MSVKIRVISIGKRGNKVSILMRIDDDTYQEIELDSDDPRLEEKLKALNALHSWKKYLERRSRRKKYRAFLDKVKKGEIHDSLHRGRNGSS